MAWNKNEIKLQLKNIFLCIVGNLLLSFASAVFYLEYDIISGGIPGLSIIFNSFWNLGENVWVFIFTWGFFIIGIFGLGKKFALKTLCSTIIYPLGVTLFTNLLMFEGSFLRFENPDTTHYVLAAIFGGILTGVGCGLTFIGGGSTGGVDIPALLLQKYAKIRVSYVSFIADAIIILSGLFVIQKFDLGLIGIMGAFITSFMMDRVFFGNKNRFIAYVVSEKYETINSFIIEKMDRGTTLIEVQGGYSKHNIKMIKVCFELREYAILKEALNKLDSKAFISIVKAHEIHGEGFENKIELFENTKLDEWFKKQRKESGNNEG